jgi:hypothetical protein
MEGLLDVTNEMKFWHLADGLNSALCLGIYRISADLLHKAKK